MMFPDMCGTSVQSEAGASCVCSTAGLEYSVFGKVEKPPGFGRCLEQRDTLGYQRGQYVWHDYSGELRLACASWLGFATAAGCA